MYNWTVDGDSGVSYQIDGNKLHLSINAGSGASITCTSGSQTVETYAHVDTVICLTGDTLITMYNGTKKRIDEMKVGDEVLSFNPMSGLLEKDIVYYSDSDKVKTHDHYDKYTFEDGTVIKCVHRHRFYNVDLQRMVHMDTWNEGERAFKQDGTAPALVKKEEGIMEETKHYTLFSKNQNYFANGLLSGNRFTKKLSKGAK